MPRSSDLRVWYHFTITTKKCPPAVILKSLVARASRAVLGFGIPHMFNLIKLDNVAEILEAIFAQPPHPSSLVGLTCDSKSVWCFSEMLISLVNQNQSKETERKFNIPEI